MPKNATVTPDEEGGESTEAAEGENEIVEGEGEKAQ